jgi:hypothetical protein
LKAQVILQAGEDSEDIDFLAESDDEAETQTPSTAGGRPDGESSDPSSSLYQEMHSRVLQRLMGESSQGPSEGAALNSNVTGVTGLAGLVHSADAFSFDAETILHNAQKEVCYVFVFCITTRPPQAFACHADY